MFTKKLLLFLFLYFNYISATDIIFDLYGVVFKIPYTQAIKQFNILDPVAYAFIDRQNPLAFNKKFIEFLSQVNVPQELKLFLPKKMLAQSSGQEMPELFYLWQLDKISYKDCLKLIFDHIEKLKSNDREKRMLKNAALLCFDLEKRKASYRPIKQCVEIIKECAAERNADGSKKHRLYVLSNMDHEMIENLTQTYPNIFGLFDGIFYSGQIKSLKPEPNIYAEFLKQNNLNPNNCIFIDDQQENIDAAKKLGFDTILCKKHSIVKQTLKNKNIISDLESNKKNKNIILLYGLILLSCFILKSITQ